MKKFDIRRYIWNVFELTDAQKLSSVYVGLELFITNLELSQYRYKGTSNVDYKYTGEKWNNLSDKEKEYNKTVFNTIVKNIYMDLCKLYRERNRDKFDDICFMNLEVFGLKPFNYKPPRHITHSYMQLNKYKKNKPKKKKSNETKG